MSSNELFQRQVDFWSEIELPRMDLFAQALIGEIQIEVENVAAVEQKQGSSDVSYTSPESVDGELF